MLAKGLEPSTVRLQGGCSTIELYQQELMSVACPSFFSQAKILERAVGMFLFACGSRKEGGDLARRGRGRQLSLDLLRTRLEFTTFLELFPRAARTGIVSANFIHASSLLEEGAKIQEIC